jgi:hypothetical protein
VNAVMHLSLDFIKAGNFLTSFATGPINTEQTHFMDVAGYAMVGCKEVCVFHGNPSFLKWCSG